MYLSVYVRLHTHANVFLQIVYIGLRARVPEFAREKASQMYLAFQNYAYRPAPTRTSMAHGQLASFARTSDVDDSGSLRNK